MLPTLETIALRRRAIGLTQAQLAGLAGVSQSYIAKLEANKIEPSYSKVKAILEALDRLEKKREAKVSDVMTPDIIGVQASETVEQAVSLMWEHGFSQLPVLDGGASVGSITERAIVERLVNGGDEGPIRNRPITEVMENPFPQIGDDASVSLAANLLRAYPAVLVQRMGSIVGIVTKSDLLKTLD
jgi:predicted transcriptional regulator